MEGNYKLIDFESGAEQFYNVTLDLAEVDDLLAGTLSPTEQAAYESLTNRLVTYRNIPRIYSNYMDTDAGFNVEIGWFDHAGFTLYRTDHLVSNEWGAVAGQEFTDTGEAALILRDPAPPAAGAFYRVVAE